MEDQLHGCMHQHLMKNMNLNTNFFSYFYFFILNWLLNSLFLLECITKLSFTAYLCTSPQFNNKY
jgi:hypothetical protein